MGRDITELRCWDGKLYLAGIKDLHEQTIVGWSMGERQTTDLVANASDGPRPATPGTGCLTHHADRGAPACRVNSRMPERSLSAKRCTGVDVDLVKVPVRYQSSELYEFDSTVTRELADDQEARHQGP